MKPTNQKQTFNLKIFTLKIVEYIYMQFCSLAVSNLQKRQKFKNCVSSIIGLTNFE